LRLYFKIFQKVNRRNNNYFLRSYDVRWYYEYTYRLYIALKLLRNSVSIKSDNAADYGGLSQSRWYRGVTLNTRTVTAEQL
jgi:hypothetical protein